MWIKVELSKPDLVKILHKFWIYNKFAIFSDAIFGVNIFSTLSDVITFDPFVLDLKTSVQVYI